MHGGGKSGAADHPGKMLSIRYCRRPARMARPRRPLPMRMRSTTTTISYADGSTVDMTTPAVSANGSGWASTGTSGQNTANLLEQLIAMQAQLPSSAASTLSAVA